MGKSGELPVQPAGVLGWLRDTRCHPVPPGAWSPGNPLWSPQLSLQCVTPEWGWRARGAKRPKAQLRLFLVQPGSRGRGKTTRRERKEGEGKRWRVLLASSQGLRQGGFPSADGDSSLSLPRRGFALFPSEDKVTVGKSHQTVTAPVAVKQLVRSQSH